MMTSNSFKKKFTMMILKKGISMMVPKNFRNNGIKTV